MSRLHRLLLSASAGILLSLAWLNLPGWTLFIAFLPLLLLDHFFIEHKHKYTSVSFWGHALVAVLIWNTLTTWWISYATVVGALLAILANSFLMSVVLWLGHLARRRFSSNLAYLALIFFWISFEYFHYHWDIEWPWLNLGNGFANNIKIIQWYEYTGTLGGTLWVWSINIILFRLLLNIRNNAPLHNIFYPAVSLVFISVVPVIFSYSIYNTYSEKVNPLNILIVQPNIDPYNERHHIEEEQEKLQSFIALAQPHITDSTDLVIGPETVFEMWPNWNTERPENNSLYRQLHEWIGKYPKTELIFGASTHKIYPNAEDASSTARVTNSTHYDVYNSAVFLGENGYSQFYHKSILVPGVEKMPFRDYLWLLNDVVFDLGGTTGSLGVQSRPSNLVLHDGTKVAPNICYESVFGGYLTEFVKEGAELIVVITNDGWWRNTSGHKQHFSFSRLRAVETRRSIARAANTGISAFINQRGDVSQSTPWWTETTISGSLNLNEDITFYVKYGDYLGRIAMFTGVLLLLSLMVKSIIKE